MPVLPDVLHGTGGVEIFQLGEDSGIQPLLLLDVGQLQQRSVADQLIGAGIDPAHGKFLLFSVYNPSFQSVGGIIIPYSADVKRFCTLFLKFLFTPWYNG